MDILKRLQEDAVHPDTAATSDWANVLFLFISF